MPPMQNEINSAIRDCLEQRYGHASPAGRTEYVAKLIDDHGWTQAQAAVVQTKALRLLAILLEPIEGA